MGVYWDTWCTICGCPPTSIPIYDNKERGEASVWMNDCIFLAADGSVVTNVREHDAQATFKSKDTDIIYYGSYELNADKYATHWGIFVHTDCYEYIRNKYGIKLTFSNFPDHKIDLLTGGNITSVDYGAVKKYWADQDGFVVGYPYFHFEDITKADEFILYSPLGKNKESEKNKKRIDKIANQLKLKGKGERKGPSVSASFYKKKVYKIGMNGKIWMISNGKWVEYKGDIVTKELVLTNKQETNARKKVSFKQLAESNTQPIFFTLKDKDVFYFIGDRKYIDKL